MINKRLFENYGIDTNKDLKIKTVCARPYDTVLIDKQGSCYACECTAWLPQSIGNLQIKTLSDILGSTMHKHLQSSVADGTYRYCNAKQCAYFKQDGGEGFIPQRQDDQIRHLRLAIDDSCNLRCPSCRKHMIFHKDGSAYQLGVRLADRIIEWLQAHQGDIQVHIGSDGDPFASHVYRHFMEQVPERDNIKYSILTNGLMFKEFHTRVPYVIANLRELGVSIDGASRDTYERLRLGGKWEKILEGLESMSEAKQKHGFQFGLHMVVQQANHHELEDMLELGRTYGADRVYFNRLEDWNTGIDFNTQTFTQIPEFRDRLKRISEDNDLRTGNVPTVYNNVISI